MSDEKLESEEKTLEYLPEPVFFYRLEVSQSTGDKRYLGMCQWKALIEMHATSPGGVLSNQVGRPSFPQFELECPKGG
jgi:hypothetical protein